jgi:hypothetical protein
VDAIGDEAATSCSAPLYPSPHRHSLIAHTLALLLTCSLVHSCRSTTK